MEAQSEIVEKMSGGSGGGYERESDQTWLEMLVRLERGGVKSLLAEYEELRLERPLGLTALECTRYPRKNRYPDVGCWDQTRVALDGDGGYIHANFVDGAFRRRQFIVTQGPLDGTFARADSTILDFWRMIWEQQVYLIVMLCRTVEGGRTKCAKYWPTTLGDKMAIGDFVICSVDAGERSIGDHTVYMTTLRLDSKEHGTQRTIVHMNHVNWPDRDVPPSTGPLLLFLDRVDHVHRSLLTRVTPPGTPVKPTPIVVHCSAGIGRSGTFVAVHVIRDILRVTGRVDIRNIVRLLRQQRQFAVQTPLQYICVYQTSIDVAIKNFHAAFDLASFTAQAKSIHHN